MAAGFLDNLLTSLGGSREGPDPSRLEGLLECARSGMPDQELRSRAQRLRARLQRALSEREASLGPVRENLDTGLIELMERNLAACRRLIELLSDLRPAHFEAYAEATRDFLETSQTLSQWKAPLCPRCGSSGSLPQICPSCGLERLIPDLEPADTEFEQGVVGAEVAVVHRRYSQVLGGDGSLADLLQALQDLEFSLLEAQAVAEDPDLLAELNRALAAVGRMHAVEDNREMRELNQGWAQLFRSAVAIEKLLAVGDQSVNPIH